MKRPELDRGNARRRTQLLQQNATTQVLTQVLLRDFAGHFVVER